MSRFEQISKLSSLKSKNKIIFDKDDPNKSLDLRPRMLIYEYIDVSCLAGGRSRREENDDDRWRSCPAYLENSASMVGASYPL